MFSAISTEFAALKGKVRKRGGVILVAWLLPGIGATAELPDWQAQLLEGLNLRRLGQIERSIAVLEQALQSAASPAEQGRVAGELGVSLYQARRLDQAEALLQKAYQQAAGIEKAHRAIDLGNLSAVLHEDEDARRWFDESLSLAGEDATVRATAGLNLARFEAAPQKLARLTALLEPVQQVGDAATQARLLINLGNQARELGKPALKLAYESLSEARRLAQKSEHERLVVESLDTLAQLYEDQGLAQDAMRLNRQALEGVEKLGPSVAADLHIWLQWRQGRLHLQAGAEAPALLAFERAAENIEATRQDIPIEFEDGRSSFSALIAPVNISLVGLLLRQAEHSDAARKAQVLGRAVEAIEQMHQAEMQDFLGDRCTVEAVQGNRETKLARGTAVLYSLLFPDRIELLLSTDSGIVHRSVAVDSATVHDLVARLAKQLRDYQSDVRPLARQLYDWILSPLAQDLRDQNIQTLIAVPDSALRVIPMAVLHDGSGYLLERYALASTAGLSMTNAEAPSVREFKALVAGLATPGSVVEKLDSDRLALIGGDPSQEHERRIASRKLARRSLAAPDEPPSAQDGAETLARHRELRDSLALPGVSAEVGALAAIMPSKRLLDGEFTLDRFRREAGSGDYRVIHVASHGVFGGSADTSFIMAHDGLLDMNGLQSLLRADKVRESPVELLTLSACETAEGNERSPLGIAGAAMKARARSILGTLWPVEDRAARTLMESFYRRLVVEGVTKADALRLAQRELLGINQFAHPFFWAPFTLVGNWQ